MATRHSTDLILPVMLFLSYSINRLTGTDGFPVLCHQSFPSSLPLPETCLNPRVAQRDTLLKPSGSGPCFGAFRDGLLKQSFSHMTSKQTRWSEWRVM